MTKDIHASSFDEGTKIKLDLVRLYIREWLPVFIKQRVENIEIYDFFAGEGSDIDGFPGSPLIILDELKTYCNNLKEIETKVHLHFNDNSKKKIEKLEIKTIEKIRRCSSFKSYEFCQFTDQLNNNCPFKLYFENQDFGDYFESIFPKVYSTQSTPRFMFIDQYGIKNVNKIVFSKLTSLKQTDFLFFISSSHILRFRELPAFKAYIDSKSLDFSGSRPSHCHRIIYDYYKMLLEGREYFLGQFSIKKESNYYGLIFGSSHPLGLKKFLDVAWRIDPHTGETNHDIDGDPVRSGQSEFDFEGSGIVNRIKKLKFYENELSEFLKIPRSNKSIYIYSLEKGINITNTNIILKSLEKKGTLAFTGDPRQKGGFYLAYNHEKKIHVQVK
jgi:three-Cys-motif partner protein